MPYILPTEETERAMYEWTEQYLAEHGYLHYEISNYAKPGRECRHNIGYWKRENYLGLGLGSASLVENERFLNTSDPEAYLRGEYEKQESQIITLQAQMEEFMFLGLRMQKGISELEFEGCFQRTLDEVYGDVINALCQRGLLKRQGGYVSLTKEGVSVSNYVMSEFLV